MTGILLGEENKTDRDVLSWHLVNRGEEIVLAIAGESGPTLAATAAPDVIAMDMGLPLLVGGETSRRLKIVPMAHATASGRDEVRAVAGDHDTGPVDLPRRLQRIEALLRTAGRGRP